MLISRAIKEYLELNQYGRQLSINTIELYKLNLGKLSDYLGCRDIRKLDMVEIQAYFDDLRSAKLHPATLRGKYSSVMAFLNYYYKTGVLKINPYYHVRKIKKFRTHKKPLCAGVLQRMLDAKPNYRCRKGFQYYRNKSIMGLLIYGGLRVGEIINLEFKDIDLSAGYIKINKGKFNIDRVVPLTEPLISWMKKYCLLRMKCRSKHYFIGLFLKGKLHKDRITKVVQICAEAAGIKRRGYAHLLRHSFASQMLKGRVDLNDLKVLMGHRDIEMTAMYAKPDRQMVRAALLSNPLVGYFGGRDD
ncbi:MAG: tyrosine-type recombinase/integrase [Candidatus Margulisiibacteriota bacterium]